MADVTETVMGTCTLQNTQQPNKQLVF